MGKKNTINIKPGGKILANNTVIGTQVSGASAEDAAKLAGASHDKNELNLGLGATLDTGTLVAGFQFIGNPATATPDDLRKELAALREKLAAAIQAGEIKSPSDAEDVTRAVERAEQELGKDQPEGGEVVNNIERASTILDKVATAITKLGGVGTAVLALAPITKALLAIAIRLFGG